MAEGTSQETKCSHRLVMITAGPAGVDIGKGEAVRVPEGMFGCTNCGAILSSSELRLLAREGFVRAEEDSTPKEMASVGEQKALTRDPQSAVVLRDFRRLEEKVDFLVALMRAFHPEWVNLEMPPEWVPGG